MFNYDPILFNNALQEIFEAYSMLNNMKSELNSLESSVPDDFGYDTELQEFNIDMQSVITKINSLYEQVVNTKNKIAELDPSILSAGSFGGEDDADTPWYVDLGNAIEDTWSSWVEGFTSLFKGEGFSDLGDALLQTGATIGVGSRSVFSGVAKVGELVVDGVVLAGGSVAAGAAYIAHDLWTDGDLSSQIMDATLDFNRTDLIGNANRDFYENTAIGRLMNEKSNLKYDSSGAQSLQTAGEALAKVTAATFATVATGGAAAPIILGAAYGAGNAADRYANTVDRENGESYDYLEALVKATAGGALGSLEFYGYGQLGQSIFSNLRALKGGATAGSTATLVNGSTSFGTNFAKNFFQMDAMLDTGAVVVDHAVSYMFGDESLEQALTFGGMELAFALGLNAIGAGVGAFVDTRSALANSKVASSVLDVLDEAKINTIAFENSETLMYEQFRSLSNSEQLDYVNKISFSQLNDLLKGADNIDETVSLNVEKYIIENQDALFKGKIYINRFDNIDSYVLSKGIFAKLSNDSLLSLIIASNNNDEVLGELYKRIDAGDIVFDRLNYMVRAGNSMVDCNMVWTAMDESYQLKVREMIREKVMALPADLRKMSTHGDYGMFSQAFLASKYADGTIDESGLKFITELYNANPNNMKSLNYNMCNQEYISDLGEDYLKEVVNNANVSSMITALHDNHPELYSSFVSLMHTYKQDNSLYTFYPKINSMLSFLYDNATRLDGLDESVIASDSFVNYVLFSERNKVNYYVDSQTNKINVPFSENFATELDAVCDDAFYKALDERNLDKMKDAYYKKYFMLDNYSVDKLLVKYGTSIDTILEHNEESASVFKYLQRVAEIDDIEVLKNEYLSETVRFDAEEWVYLDDRLRRAYAMSYVDTLAETDSFIKNALNANASNVSYVNVGDKAVSVVEVDDNFSLIVRSTDSGLVSSEVALRNNSYVDTYRHTDSPTNHILACSYITQKNIGSCPVNNKGVLYGYTNITEDKLVMMSPHDITSEVNNIGYNSVLEQRFIAASEMSNYTLRGYNEICLERVGTEPNYVIVYDDFTEEQLNNAYLAASQWGENGIPVIRINKTELVNNQANLINGLMSDFKDTRNIESLDAALQLYEANTSGFKMNLVHNERIDNIHFADENVVNMGAFDSVGIEGDIMDYISELAGKPDNAKEVDEVIKVFENLKMKYDISNKYYIGKLSNSESNFELNTLIEMLKEIRSE